MSVPKVILKQAEHIDLEVVAGPKHAFDLVDLLDECRSTPAIIDGIDAAMGDAKPDLNGPFA